MSGRTTTARPYGKTILVRVDAPETEKQVGDLLVIQSASEEPFIGEVIAFGDAINGIPVGGQVMFSRYAGHVVDLDGVKHHVIDADDVLLVWP